MGLYRPTVVRKRKDGTPFKTKSRIWWASFRDPDGERVQRSMGTRDKRAAELAMSEAIRRAFQEGAGLINPYEHHL